jgi:hypothetical protein
MRFACAKQQDMEAADSGLGGDALEVFADWLTRREQGAFAEFDELLRGQVG